MIHTSPMFRKYSVTSAKLLMIKNRRIYIVVNKDVQ